MEYLTECPHDKCPGKGKAQPPLPWARTNCAYCSMRMTAQAVTNSNRRAGGSGKSKPSEQSQIGMKLLFRNTPKGDK